MKPAFEKKQEIDNLIKKLEPNSERRRLIDAARAFKSNWVTFGEYLTRVASEKAYEEWGYRSFEEYCSLEIRIKKNTAIKLTNAYFFATETEPAIAKSFEEKGVPELDVVNFLHKAKNDEACTDEMFEDLKEGALEKAQSGPTLARRFKQMTAPTGEAARNQSLEQTLKLIGRLQQKLQMESETPSHYFEYLEEIYEFLSQQVSPEAETESESQDNA